MHQQRSSVEVMITAAPARPVAATRTLTVVIEGAGASSPFAIDKVPPGNYLLSWSGPRIAAGSRTITVQPGSPLYLGTVSLHPAYELQGRVLDEQGLAVPQATIRLVPEGQPSPRVLAAVSNSDGDFAVRGIPLGTVLRFSATADTMETAAGRLGGETRLIINMRRRQRITGRLVDEAGRALTNVSVRTAYLSQPNGPAARTSGTTVTSDGEGNFNFYRLRPLRTEVRIDAGGYRPLLHTLDAPSIDAPRELEIGILVLHKGRTIAGHVYDRATGAPLPGARVLDSARRLTSEGTLTRTDGYYELGGCSQDDDVMISASAQNRAPETRLASRSGEDTLDFTLGEGGAIEGRVCGTGTEIDATEVSVSCEGRRFWATAALGRDGRFAVRLLEPGSYVVSRRWKIGYPGTDALRLLSAAGTVRAGVLDGTTTRTDLACDGIPVSGQLFLGSQPMQRAFASLVIGNLDGSAFRTDETGRFTTRVPLPGQYRVQVAVSPESGSQGGELSEASCYVPESGTTSCELHLGVVQRDKR